MDRTSRFSGSDHALIMFDTLGQGHEERVGCRKSIQSSLHLKPSRFCWALNGATPEPSGVNDGCARCHLRHHTLHPRIDCRVCHRIAHMQSLVKESVRVRCVLSLAVGISHLASFGVPCSNNNIESSIGINPSCVP